MQSEKLENDVGLVFRYASLKAKVRSPFSCSSLSGMTGLLTCILQQCLGLTRH